MNINDLNIMRHPHDHIMANTWRLIFESKAWPTATTSLSQPVPDFTMLEQLLPEYRLIGLTLADNRERRPN